MSSFIDSLYFPYVVTLGLVAIATLLLHIFNKKIDRSIIDLLFAVSWGFAWLGITIGLFAGNSREPAVNTVISSSLTLIGVIVVYLFDKNAFKVHKQEATVGLNFYIPVICLLVLPITLLYGAVVGTQSRTTSEDNELKRKLRIEQQQKFNDELIRVNEDSIKTFLEIYKDTVEASFRANLSKK